MLDGAIVHLDSEASAADLRAAITAVTADGPLVLGSVERAGAGRYRCTFRLRRPGLAVGYRHVIDLQHRLDRAFHLVGVEAWRAEPLAPAS